MNNTIWFRNLARENAAITGRSKWMYSESRNVERFVEAWLEDDGSLRVEYSTY